MMTIAGLIHDLPIRVRRGDAGTPVVSVADDSRQVVPGGLFVARRGRARDGAAFLADALDKGAGAVLVAAGVEVPPDGAGGRALVLETDDPDAVLPVLAERFHGEPSRKLALIGVTGTKGKTTTAWLVRHLLSVGGLKCGLFGTVEIDDGRERRPASLTTPPAIELSATLARMVEHGCRAAVMEVSSHSLDQGRVAGLRFVVGAFTNLTGDHLDYHGTMDAYAAAKSRLFTMLDAQAVAVVNADDPRAQEMIARSPARVLRCGLQTPGGEAGATIFSMDASETHVAFHGPWGAVDVRLPLIGRHNVANALLAAAIAHVAGADAEAIALGLSSAAAPPGRLQPVSRADEPLTVLVDYAHTDDALDKVLTAVRPIVPEGAKLWVVFGCGGDRDRTKRPRMARVACALADRVVVTSDNPRTEPPDSIVREILTGVPADAGDRVEPIVDRREAIHHAVLRAEDGDVIVIAGKGHEDYQIIGAVKHPFDDRLVARAALNERLGSMVTP